MSARLRVLLDAAPLGFGVEPGIGRAGIFRATEGFVRQALDHADLDVDVAAVEHYLASVQLYRYDRATGGGLKGRRKEFWRHPVARHADTAATVDQVVAVGEDSDEARRPVAALTLTNRLAQFTTPAQPYDIYHSLRPALMDRHRLPARARVLTVHDVIPLQHEDWCAEGSAAWMRAALSTVDPSRDWILCHSHRVHADILDVMPIDGARVLVVPLAADPAVFHPVADRAAIDEVRRRYGLGARPYVLSLCTIEPRKNLAHLLRGVTRLIDRPEHRDLQLVLVGPPGWKMHADLAAIDSSRVRDRIRMTGYVADADLAALYAGADLFACPSHYEGFGLPVLEAMQCGVPVVTTTGGAIPEVAGDAALLVDPRDEAMLVAALAAARRNADLAAKGLARASLFNWARTVDLTIAAYRTMLSMS